MKQSDLISIGRAAGILQRAWTTVAGMVERGEIESVKTPKGVRIPRAAVEELLKQSIQ